MLGSGTPAIRGRQPYHHDGQPQRPQQRLCGGGEARHRIRGLSWNGHRRSDDGERLHLVADQLRQRHLGLEHQ